MDLAWRPWFHSPEWQNKQEMQTRAERNLKLLPGVSFGPRSPSQALWRPCASAPDGQVLFLLQVLARSLHLQPPNPSHLCPLSHFHLGSLQLGICTMTHTVLKCRHGLPLETTIVSCRTTDRALPLCLQSTLCAREQGPGTHATPECWFPCGLGRAGWWGGEEAGV